MSHRVHKEHHRGHHSHHSDGAYTLVYQTEVDSDNEQQMQELGGTSSLGHHKHRASGNFSHIDVENYSTLHTIVDSTAFQLFVVFLTLANGVVIGLETDYAHIFHWGYVEKGFIVLFTLEILLKLLAIGPSHYFNYKNSEVAWNVFDVVIVSAGVVDVMVTLTMGDFRRGHFSTIMRMFRLLRVLRLLRIVRYLKKLYLLAVGLIEAAKAVIWITILMTFVIYICSIVLVRTVGRLPPTAFGSEFLSHRFGTVESAMLTLFQFMSSPTLIEYENGIMENYPFLIGFLVFWIIFGSFGMVAMLTGVISESIFDKNQMWIDEVRSEKEDTHRAIKAWCRQAFSEVPHDNHGEASKSDILALLPACKELCERLGVDFTYHELKKSVKYMDHSNSGGINCHEFVHGILNVLEGERPVGFQELKHSIRVTLLHVERMMEFVRNIHGVQQEQMNSAREFGRNSTPAKQGPFDERLLSAIMRVEDTCSMVRQVADKQRDCIRDISELAVAMGATLQSMSDFANDVRQNGLCEPLKEITTVKEVENRELPKEDLEKILKGFHDTLMAELSAKSARIDQVLDSLREQHDLSSDAGGRCQPIQLTGSVDDNLSRTIASIKAEVLLVATSTVVAERTMISDLISQMRSLIDNPSLLAVDLGDSACSRSHGSDGDTGGPKVRNSHQ